MSDKVNEIEVRGPSTLIEMALTNGADEKALEKLEKVLELQERWEANEAKKAYVKAMAEFKKDPPHIYKDKENKQYTSRYSSIDATVNATIPKLAEYGFSHNWQFGKTESGNPQVTCVLTHEFGHSESVTFDAPPDTSGGGSKNPIQQIKSTHTYLKIATFEAVTGLVSREINVDDDGNSASVCIGKKQVAEIEKKIKEVKADKGKFLGYLKVKSVEDIPLESYDTAMTALASKAGV